MVVGDIREGLEARDGLPEARVEQFGNRWRSGDIWHAPSLRVGYSRSAAFSGRLTTRDGVAVGGQAIAVEATSDALRGGALPAIRT